MDKEKLLDSLVFDYLQRTELNSSVLFSMNRNPVSLGFCSIIFMRTNNFYFIERLENVGLKCTKTGRNFRNLFES